MIDTSRRLPLALAVLFVLSALPKLAGLALVEEVFVRFGYSEGFMMLVGVLELAGGVGLLVPPVRLAAALGLLGIMVGAVVSHLRVDPLSMALPALAVGAGLAVVAWRDLRALRAGGDRSRPRAPAARSRL